MPVVLKASIVSIYTFTFREMRTCIYIHMYMTLMAENMNMHLIVDY